MPFLSDTVLDQALQYITDNADRLDLCSQEPTTYAQATSTYSLGRRVDIAFAAPSNRTAGGRRVLLATTEFGETTANGTATHWALTDTTGTALLATGPLASSQPMMLGATFNTGAISIGIPDAVAEA